MNLTWRAHGAARIGAGLGCDPDLPEELPDALREQLTRAEVSEEDAHLAWELARLANLPPVDHQALMILILLTQDALARGSTRLAIDDRTQLIEQACTLGADEATATRMVSLLDRTDEAPLNALFGEDRPLVIAENHLYHQRLRAVERRLVRRVVERLGRPAAELDSSAAIERLRRSPSLTSAGPLVLTAEQEEAVHLALRSPLTVISGGPGTGKTSIVVAILRAAVGLGKLEPPSIALAAPTGKAADRMRRAIDGILSAVTDPTVEDRLLAATLPAPRTLHRLLGYSPSRGSFRHHADNPLSERLVVVDESSMVDVFLVERLLESLHERAQLVLIGDAEQLPSVAAGAVFRDLGGASCVPSVTLTESHRMDPRRPEGFNVLSVAARINAGETPALVAPALASSEVDGTEGSMLPSDPRCIGRLDAPPEDPDRLRGVFLFEPRRSLDRESLLDAWYRRRVEGSAELARMARRTWSTEEGRLTDAAVAGLFDFMERARLLCVTRSAARPTGVDAVNASLHRRHAEALGVPAIPGRLLAGEPLLVTRNDYERNLFNGDQGVVLWTRGEHDPAPRLSAVFRRETGFSAHPIEVVRPSIDLGFATTVHKAQGSEHDGVALLLPDTDSPRLLTREIVYTAVTRARRSVLVVGSHALLRRAVTRRIVRSSGVRTSLEEHTREGASPSSRSPADEEGSSKPGAAGQDPGHG